MQADLTFLQMVTRDKFLPAVVDNIYDTNRIFKMMKSRIKEASGTSLSWTTVAKRNKNVSRFAGFSIIPNQATNPLAKLSLNPGEYVGTISFPTDQLIMNTGAKEKLLDMAKAQMTSVEDQLTEDIGLDMYSDGSLVNGLQGVVGLAGAVASGNTYAGVDRSQAPNAYWRANVFATATTNDDLENPVAPNYLPRLMATQFSAATHKGSPTLIVTQEAIYNHYAHHCPGPEPSHHRAHAARGPWLPNARV